MIVKRTFDMVVASLGVIVLTPFFLMICIWIWIDAGCPVLYRQVRVGKDGEPFKLLKFRSMVHDSDRKGSLTIGSDPRVTRSGTFLRKYKVDELPQLFNVIKGDMNIVGPRPEVPRYVDLYSKDQRRVLEIRPGITDLASIQYRNENEILGKAHNPEKEYIEHVMPDKLRINLEYLEKRSFWTDLRIIIRTVLRIIRD